MGFSRILKNSRIWRNIQRNDKNQVGKFREVIGRRENARGMELGIVTMEEE